MKNVMTRAWEIAKAAEVKFGGKASEYIAGSLKMAWAETRKVEPVEVIIGGNRRAKSWIAEITGTHPKFGLDRKFVSEHDRDGAWLTFRLQDGVYEICDKGKRVFVKVENGEECRMEYNEVREYAQTLMMDMVA